MPYHAAIDPKGTAGLHEYYTLIDDMKPYWQTITSEFGHNRSFPGTENPAEAGLLIGNCRPEKDLPDFSGEV